MDNRQLQGKSIWETGTLSGDASCLSFTFIFILIFQHFIYPLWASLKICLTEAGPLTLSEEGACQLLPRRRRAPWEGLGPFPTIPPGPGPGASREAWPGGGCILKRGGRDCPAHLPGSTELGVESWRDGYSGRGSLSPGDHLPDRHSGGGSLSQGGSLS